jgi:hypothetical protein
MVEKPGIWQLVHTLSAWRTGAAWRRSTTSGRPVARLDDGEPIRELV